MPGKGGRSGTSVVIFEKSYLDRYAAMSDSVIIRMFDFTRFRPSHFQGWSPGEESELDEGDLISFC